MDSDYLLVAVDQAQRYSIRLLSLSQVVAKSLQLHALKGDALRRIYAEFLAASVLIGSRHDDQETALFKLKLTSNSLTINCEVSPRGPCRSAVFPSDQLENFRESLQGQLEVVKLRQADTLYRSLVAVAQDGLIATFRDYLRTSDQSQSVLQILADIAAPGRSFGLWVDRLPGTSDAHWLAVMQRLGEANTFSRALAESTDPDHIMQTLVPEGFRILAVTRPRLECPCSKERLLDALATLPEADRLELFMDRQAVETRCDYCRRVWHVTGAELRQALHLGGSIH